jgi:translation initiation factor IF-3
MDYGKYKYEQKKKKGASKAKAHAATMKEVKVRPRTDEHDLDFKLRNARRFLMEGDKVKITLMFRGREIVHQDLGRDQLDRVEKMLSDIANVENAPRMDGRFLSMILVPNREAIAKLERAAKTQSAPAAGPPEAGEAAPVPVEEPEAARRERAAGEK